MVAHLTNLVPVWCRQEERELLCPPYSKNKFNIQRRAGQIRVSFVQSAGDGDQQNRSKFLSVLYSKENSSRSERKQKIKNIQNEAAMARNYISCIFIGKMLQEVCKMFGVSLCCLFYSITGKKYLSKGIQRQLLQRQQFYLELHIRNLVHISSSLNNMQLFFPVN